ncbi:MAG: DEAD/DEAH box helicase family protein [Myxococcota bacterium]
MESIRLTFDRGTLRLDGEVSALRGALRFDERTGFHRAPAYKYATLIQAARERGLAVDDQLCSGFRAIEQTPAPPSLRPYQEQALAAFHRFGRRGIIALPTGSGKTRVACAALAYARVSTLVLVPTRVLRRHLRRVRQLPSDLAT